MMHSIHSVRIELKRKLNQ